MKLTLYCESKFLTSFFDERPREASETLFSETKVDDWRNFRKLIFTNSINLDVDFEEFTALQKRHPFWTMLAKKKMDGEIKLKLNKFPVNYDEVNQQSLFFITDKEESDNLENQYGLLFICNANLYDKSKFLFSHDNFRKIDNKTDWNVLGAFKHPCNSMHIIDNYLFKRKDVVEKNLKVLLDTLLPERIDKEFNIKINTKDPTKEDNGRNDWLGQSKEQLEEYVVNIVKSVRKNMAVTVDIHFTKYSGHDRHLLTNYFWFSCGYGFVLNDNERSEGTDVHIHSISSPNVLARIKELNENDSEKIIGTVL